MIVTPRIMKRKWVLLVFLSVSMAGCYGWRTTTLPAQEIIPLETQSSVRLTRANGSVVTLRLATMSNDSIVGVDEFRGEERRVATSDVRTIEVRRISVWRIRSFYSRGGGNRRWDNEKGHRLV